MRATIQTNRFTIKASGDAISVLALVGPCLSAMIGGGAAPDAGAMLGDSFERVAELPTVARGCIATVERVEANGLRILRGVDSGGTFRASLERLQDRSLWRPLGRLDPIAEPLMQGDAIRFLAAHGFRPGDFYKGRERDEDIHAFVARRELEAAGIRYSRTAPGEAARTPHLMHEGKIEQAIGMLCGHPEWHEIPQPMRDRFWGALRWLVDTTHGVEIDAPFGHANGASTAWLLPLTPEQAAHLTNCGVLQEEFHRCRLPEETVECYITRRWTRLGRHDLISEAAEKDTRVKPSPSKAAPRGRKAGRS